MKKYIVVIVLLLSNSIYAHKDIWREFKYGNIRAGIVTGFEAYEEINKVKIINQLALKLSTALKYDKPIFLHFKHNYIDSINKPEYFISHDTWQLNQDKKENKGLHLRFYGSEYDVLQCLKVVEYAILNVKEITLLQKEVLYKGEFGEETHIAIDSKSISSELMRKESEILKGISSTKIYADDSKDSQGFTYYWQDYKFHIEYVNMNERNTVLTLKNIRYFEYVWGDILVFDTQTTFYSLKLSTGEASKKQTIDSMNVNFIYDFDNHSPYRIQMIGKSKFAITMGLPAINDKRIVYYSHTDDIIVQDLNKFIWEKR